MSGTLFNDEAETPTIKTLAPWFGSNRTLAKEVGEEFRGLTWLGVPFAGGMTELVHLRAPTIVVSDLHRHIVNLAMVTADGVLGPRLYRALRRTPFHATIHQRAQEFARSGPVAELPDYAAAVSYFAAVWMGRSARAGMASELTGGSCVRWTGNGGSSATRYRSAVGSLRAWRAILQRCDFVVMDAFDFLAKTKDEPRHGIYLDPPFPGPGDSYKHKFSVDDQRRLAAKLSTYKQARVVCRFYDHPLIRELYPEGKSWTWRRLSGRDQTNNDEKPEVLIINGPSYAGGSSCG
jgi:DNA adenine methylase